MGEHKELKNSAESWSYFLFLFFNFWLQRMAAEILASKSQMKLHAPVVLSWAPTGTYPDSCISFLNL